MTATVALRLKPFTQATPQLRLTARRRGSSLASPVPILGGREALGSDFIDIYEEHVWQVYGYLAYRVRAQADAEDLTQLTFERAFKAWDRFDERKASAGTWLIAIARNALIDHGRSDKSSRHRSISGDEVAESDLPIVEGPDAFGVDPDLASAIEQLDDRERHLLALRFGAGFTGPEIAEIADLSLANVQQILSRALRKLRVLLEARSQAWRDHGRALES